MVLLAEFLLAAPRICRPTSSPLPGSGGRCATAACRSRVAPAGPSAYRDSPGRKTFPNPCPPRCLVPLLRIPPLASPLGARSARVEIRSSTPKRSGPLSPPALGVSLVVLAGLPLWVSLAAASRPLACLSPCQVPVVARSSRPVTTQPTPPCALSASRTAPRPSSRRCREPLYWPSPACTLGSGSHARTPFPSGRRSRLAPGSTPRMLATPRAQQVRFRLPRSRRGARCPPLLQRGLAGSTCLAVAPHPSSLSVCSLP